MGIDVVRKHAQARELLADKHPIQWGLFERQAEPLMVRVRTIASTPVVYSVFGEAEPDRSAMASVVSEYLALLGQFFVLEFNRLFSDEELRYIHETLNVYRSDMDPCIAISYDDSARVNIVSKSGIAPAHELFYNCLRRWQGFSVAPLPESVWDDVIRWLHRRKLCTFPDYATFAASSTARVPTMDPCTVYEALQILRHRKYLEYVPFIVRMLTGSAPRVADIPRLQEKFSQWHEVYVSDAGFQIPYQYLLFRFQTHPLQSYFPLQFEPTSAAHRHADRILATLEKDT